MSVDSRVPRKPIARRPMSPLGWWCCALAVASVFLTLGCSVEPLTEAQARETAIAAVRDSMVVWRHHYDPDKLPEPNVDGPNENYAYLVTFIDTAQNIGLYVILRDGGVNVSGDKLFDDTMIVSSKRR